MLKHNKRKKKFQREGRLCLYKGIKQWMTKKQFEDAVIEAKNKWQNEVMIEIFDGHITLVHKGVIIAATGSGKTYLQAKMIIRLAQILGGFGVVVVKSPRIQLTQQLTKNIQEIAIKENINVDSIMFHSGNGIELVEDVDPDNLDEVRKAIAYAKKIGATTEKEVVKLKIEECKKSNTLLIIQSTYHSFDKLCSLFIEEDITVDMILNDECQYVETFGHSDCIATREYFFTATVTKGSVGGKQMFSGNEGSEVINSDFGVEIYKLTPSKAIAEGIITPASYINIQMNDVTELEAKELSHKTIVKSHGELKKVKKGNATNMLVTESGVPQIKALTKPNSELMQWSSENRRVLTVASTYGTVTDNGENISRPEFSERLIKYSKDESIDLIIIHYDILSEGIDVPSMHGVLFLRNVSTAKFYQILGRCLRTSFGKDYGYLIVPSYSDDTSMLETYKNYIEDMFKAGYLPMDVKHPADGGSSGEYEPDEAQLSHTDIYINTLIETEEEKQRKLKLLMDAYNNRPKLMIV
jgi:predicted helicase